jgi:hypothetical protein
VAVAALEVLAVMATGRPVVLAVWAKRYQSSRRLSKAQSALGRLRTATSISLVVAVAVVTVLPLARADWGLGAMAVLMIRAVPTLWTQP